VSKFVQFVAVADFTLEVPDEDAKALVSSRNEDEIAGALVDMFNLEEDYVTIHAVDVEIREVPDASGTHD
jgi:hypothetical protein